MPNKKKKKLSQQQEFEIMKLVLDKFLWLGTALIGLSVYFTVVGGPNLTLLLAGIVVLIIFVVLLVREYEISK